MKSVFGEEGGGWQQHTHLLVRGAGWQPEEGAEPEGLNHRLGGSVDVHLVRGGTGSREGQLGGVRAVWGC